MAKDTCAVEGCNKAVRARGWCSTHYRQHFTINGELGVPQRGPAVLNARFDSGYYVDSKTGCHVWQRSCYHNGYAQFAPAGVGTVGHRFAYERKYGQVPAGLQLDHYLYPERCYGPVCVNPDHVRPVTARENTMRSDGISARNAAKTHCKRGHPFDEANTYLLPNGRRACRACNNAKPRRVTRCVECAQDKPHKAHGMCAVCANRARRQHGKPCDKCGRPGQIARGMCSRCYQQSRR